MKKSLLKYAIVLLCAILAGGYCYAQYSGGLSIPGVKNNTSAAVEDSIKRYPAAEALQLMPVSDVPLLSEMMRFEMVTYKIEADSIKKVRNVFAGQSWIEEMTPDYLKVHLSDVSSLTVKRLDAPKMKGKNLIMSLYTIAGDSDTADSTLKFYSMSEDKDGTMALTALPTKRFFKLPAPSDFYVIPRDSKMREKDLNEEFPFHTVEYTIDADSGVLTGRPTIDNYLTEEQRERLQPYLVKEIKWKWNGKEFKRL